MSEVRELKQRRAPQGYVSGVPGKRYESVWGVHVWTSIIILLLASISTAVSLLTGANPQP
jgi:hypothetical protein